GQCSAAFKLCRFVECPHSPRGARSLLPLTGPPAFCNAARTYSIVSRVGFAPGFAYLGGGAFRTCAMAVTIRIYLVYVSFHPMRETIGANIKVKGKRGCAGGLAYRCSETGWEARDRSRIRSNSRRNRRGDFEADSHNGSE